MDQICPGRLHKAIKTSKMDTVVTVSTHTGLFFPIYFKFPSVPVLRPVAFASFRATDYVFPTSQIWDIERFLEYVEGWCGTFIPHFHAHIRRSHLQRAIAWDKDRYLDVRREGLALFLSVEDSTLHTQVKGH
jgi:hypothetical protein